MCNVLWIHNKEKSLIRNSDIVNLIALHHMEESGASRVDAAPIRTLDLCPLIWNADPIQSDLI